uniref:Uncharacterized protein n=1 Tax=uncultured Thiotrichaceae bacterium TaxID=298394 RepID=A0A6S6SDI2_9GAMM|nr:MAG: Unknown protein [uncultured Thiotrichaceae bacterium]
MNWIMLWSQLCCAIKRIEALEQNSGGSSGTLEVTQTELFEYQNFVVEESSAIQSNQSEWSWANGATGIIGVRVDEGWELISLSFQANVYAANAQAMVRMHDFSNGSTAAATIIADISLTNSTDGGGQTNNAHKIVEFTPTVPIPSNTVVGFRTGCISGNV